MQQLWCATNYILKFPSNLRSFQIPRATYSYPVHTMFHDKILKKNMSLHNFINLTLWNCSKIVGKKRDGLAPYTSPRLHDKLQALMYVVDTWRGGVSLVRKSVATPKVSHQRCQRQHLNFAQLHLGVNQGNKAETWRTKELNQYRLGCTSSPVKNPSTNLTCYGVQQAHPSVWLRIFN